MCEIPNADALEGLVSVVSASKVTSFTNLVLPHGDDLGTIKADAKNASGVTTRKIANERPSLPVPYLHGGVVAATDNPFLVHAHAPYKPSMGVRVTLEAEHAGLAGYSTTSAGAQNDTMATGVTHARDRRRHVLLVEIRYELQVGFRGGTAWGGYGVQFFAGRPTFTSVDVN